MHILNSVHILAAWLPLFSFADAFGTLDATAADLPYNGPAGLPFCQPWPLVVPLSNAEIVDGFCLLAAF